MGNHLKKLRETKEWTLVEAADRFGMSYGGYIKMERSERGLKAPRIEQAAQIYGVPTSAIITGTLPVRIVGEVGAGETHILFDEGQGSREYVDPPAGASGDTVAARIIGDSLGRFFNGWFVFYNEVRRPFDDSLINELCIVGLSTGQILVKKIERGSRKTRYNLVSLFGPPEYDVQIEWAAKVIDIAPRVPFEVFQPAPDEPAALPKPKAKKRKK
jgi:transcriptional regulator with XRE-family HTH domain